MKRRTLLSVIFFFIGFAITYLSMCYLPYFRIKLAAAPMEYFVKSLQHMALFKGMLSFAIGAILAILPIIIKRKQ